METKKCIECGNEISGQKKMYCSNNCKQKHHYKRVKEQTNTYHSQTERSLRRKIKLIEMLGGGCSACGYKNNLAALEFHHEDPNLKDDKLDMRTLANRSWDFILKEVEKCKLLCSNCHREHHNPELEIEKISFILMGHDKRIEEKVVVNKPKCIDCGDEINYRHIRCSDCSNKNKRKVERPDLKLLHDELNENGVTWCSKKYGVSRKTIHRWLERQIQ